VSALRAGVAPADRPRRGRPPARNEVLRAGKLGGVDPEELAAHYATPYFAYDLDVITRQVEALQAILPTGFEVAYAVKANPSLGVVGHLAGLGLGADVASRGELVLALRAGVSADRIVMTGPGKRDDELRAAVQARIRAVTVESPGELRRLEGIAADEGRRVPILLRGPVSAAAALERVRLVGDDGAGKFGMDAADLVASAEHASASRHLEFLGLHLFGASNVLDAAMLADHIERTMAAARELARVVGANLRLVDVGGGLGIPYEPTDESIDLGGLGRRLADIAERATRDPVLHGATVLLEPGRFLVGPAGAYVARVVERKSVGGREVVILDGGIHHVLRPALVGQEHRVRRLGGDRDSVGRFAPVTVAGPLCSGLDVLATEVMLAAPGRGDLVAVLDVGAYGFTESMPYFLSHPIPAEVAVRGGRHALLRPRVEPDAWLAAQCVPEW
jgi:diaminopimelate decarboxylase